MNYIRGRRITVTFDSSTVSKVDVSNQDLASSLYLEPNPDSTARCGHLAAAADSAAAGRPAREPAAVPPATPPPTTSVPDTRPPARRS